MMVVDDSSSIRLWNLSSFHVHVSPDVNVAATVCRDQCGGVPHVLHMGTTLGVAGGHTEKQDEADDAEHNEDYGNCGAADGVTIVWLVGNRREHFGI